MSKVNILRNIISGVWAIETSYAQAYFPAIYNILNNADSVLPVITEPQFQLINSSHHVNTRSSLDSTNEKSIAIINIKGAIVKYDVECGETGTETYANMIENALQNESIAGIILDIDSGGGSGDAVNRITDVIKSAKKPIIAYVGNGMAASAAYWIASACKEIYATYKTDEIGSIGTYVTLADFKAFYASKGLPIIEVYATDSTEKNKPFREALAGNVDYLRENYIDPFNKEFQNTVKTNRKGKLNLADYPDVMKGKLFTADVAVKAGLIDGLKSFKEVINRTFELANGANKGANNSKNQNQIDMSKFAKLAMLVGVATHFESTAEGVHLSEEMLTSIEEALTAKETAESALATATTKATDLETKVSTLTTEATTSANKIAELETKVTELGKEHPGVKGAATSNSNVETTAGADGKKSDAELYPWLADLPNNPLFAKVTTEN